MPQSRPTPDFPLRIAPPGVAGGEAFALLMARFFAEEGFATPLARIRDNLAAMLADGSCWVAQAVLGEELVGLVTVTTMRYVEWGLFAEIGDLYVVPEQRRSGIAARLIAAAVEWSRERGCSAVSVTLTPEGEARHGLARFYAGQGFAATGRTIMSRIVGDPGW